MAITGNSSKLLSTLLDELNKQFKMKDLGRLHYFLVIQIQYHENGMFLSQQKYVEDLLAATSMSTCAPVATPLPQQLNKVPKQKVLFENPKYFRSLAGRLQYLTLTRPDLQFSVNYVCEKMHEPSVSDFHLRYIKGTTTMGVSFARQTDSKLRVYSDSDYSGCPSTSRSTGGFCTFLARNMISWSSKKQQTMSKSSTEAEYRAMSEAASEITWIVNLLQDLGIQLPATPELNCDNLSAVYLTANPSFHARTKHFVTHYHYVREQVAFGNLIVNHIPAHFQLADIFTKSLPQRPFEYYRAKLGVGIPPTPSLRGSVKNRAQNDTVLSTGSHCVKPIKLKACEQDTKKKPTTLQRSPATDNKALAKETVQSTTVTLHNRFKMLGPVDEEEAT
ncbi:PREDICTED: uncharacterized protein LOC109126875 [Camelina sativa]|uniref:Uncharacterized protein LOC109126875 n=1 Tax=Camelina sativa TaxID=90675 RepID=A0ABM1QHS0_CAMSA|nr:PREDICTED: uncharacterized protein LOC109126875 [Camelina sativa]